MRKPCGVAILAVSMLLLDGVIGTSEAYGAIIEAAGCSQEDVQAASDGDTVLVPTGTATWTSPAENAPAALISTELTLEEGYAVARQVGLSVLSTVRDSMSSLDEVVRLVKVLGMVNCTPNFTKQPQVINGLSELTVQVFGETQGKAARSAAGVGSLPGNIPVEVEAVFEVRE